MQMVTFVNTVPIDDKRSVNRFCLIRNFAGWEGFDAWARRAMFKILGEDKVCGWLMYISLYAWHLISLQCFVCLLFPELLLLRCP